MAPAELDLTDERSIMQGDSYTLTVTVGGSLYASTDFALTADEAAMYAPSPPPVDDRLSALEATNAALLADLAKVTTVAQIRAAATKAADL